MEIMYEKMPYNLTENMKSTRKRVEVSHGSNDNDSSNH